MPPESSPPIPDTVAAGMYDSIVAGRSLADILAGLSYDESLKLVKDLHDKALSIDTPFEERKPGEKTAFLEVETFYQSMVDG